GHRHRRGHTLVALGIAHTLVGPRSVGRILVDTDLGRGARSPARGRPRTAPSDRWYRHEEVEAQQAESRCARSPDGGDAQGCEVDAVPERWGDPAPDPGREVLTDHRDAEADGRDVVGGQAVGEIRGRRDPDTSAQRIQVGERPTDALRQPRRRLTVYE